MKLFNQSSCFIIDIFLLLSIQLNETMNITIKGILCTIFESYYTVIPQFLSYNTVIPLGL